MGYRIIALSSSASKRDFALSLGAEEYVDGSQEDHADYLQEKGGVACIVSTAPSANVVGNLIGGLAPDGKLLVLSRTSPSPSSSPHPLYLFIFIFIFIFFLQKKK